MGDSIGARLTGLRLNDNNGDSFNMIHVAGHKFRIDHCYFYNSASSYLDVISVDRRDLSVTGRPYGVIDSCKFEGMRIVVNTYYNFWDINKAWYNDTLGLGDERAVYVEDCIFDNSLYGISCIDGNRGGAYVFRFNDVEHSYIEAHSLQNDQERAIRRWEIYGNNITNNGTAIYYPFRIRGGTGIIFSNTISGAWTNIGIAFDNVRDITSVGNAGLCDGNSLWDKNETGESGWWCRDQIGTSTDTSLWTEENPHPEQTRVPAYVWNNTYNGSEVSVDEINKGDFDHIQSDRDYYKLSTNFDGTSGIGVGPLSSRPDT